MEERVTDHGLVLQERNGNEAFGTRVNDRDATSNAGGRGMLTTVSWGCKQWVQES